MIPFVNSFGEREWEKGAEVRMTVSKDFERENINALACS